MEISLDAAIPQRPQIFNYRSHREFLRDFYHFRKTLRSGFSFRRFSQMVGTKSPNYLQLVMQGKRNLSATTALKVAKALSLEVEESRFFCKLVELEISSTEESREKIQSELFRIASTTKVKKIPQSQQVIVGKWYHLLIRELVCLPDFEPTGQWISEKLRGLISPDDGEKSLSLLLSAGFLRFSNGRYEALDPAVDTGNTFGEAAVIKVHQAVLKTWAEILPQTDHELREIGLINIPIASSKMPELKQRIRAFQDEVIGWLQEEKSPDRVVQLGVYLVPITTCAAKSKKPKSK